MFALCYGICSPQVWNMILSHRPKHPNNIIISMFFILSCLISSHIIPACLLSSHLISPFLTSPSTSSTFHTKVLVLPQLEFSKEIGVFEAFPATAFIDPGGFNTVSALSLLFLFFFTVQLLCILNFYKKLFD